METTITILKEHTPTALMLLVAGFLLQNDLGGEIREIRADMAADKEEIRADIAALRADMNDGFQAIRAEMAESDQAIRTEMTEEFKAVRADISMLGERITRVETRLTGIERVLYTDTSRPPM